MTLVLGACFAAGTLQAATYVEDTYDAGFEGWESRNEPARGAYGTVANTDVDSDGDTDIEVDVATGDITETDAIYLDSLAGGLLGSDGSTGNDFTTYGFGGAEEGDAVGYITFDFWSNADKSVGGDYRPAALEFYFVSDLGGGNETEWRINIFGQLDTDSDSGWNYMDFWMYQGNFTHQYGALSFAASMADVDQMGILISYTSQNGQEYGIDNFQLHNPEPGTYAVLAFALVSLGVTFRGKLRSGIKGLLRK
jgi:hypothetical protein